MDNDFEKLNDCPFCGGKCDLPKYSLTSVVCSKCGTIFNFVSNTEKGTIELFNKRVVKNG